MNRRDVFKLFGGIPAVKSVEQLKLDPGDAIVLRFEQHLSAEAHYRIAETFKTCFKGRFKDTPVIVLDGGAKIEVLKKT